LYPNRDYCTHMVTSTSTYRDSVAAEMRAEMARQRKTVNDLASLLQVSQSAASRRYNGEVDISFDELAVVADWLRVEFTAWLVRPSAVSA
jgi:transcriptional regulator with XRE-family HTH domain